MPTVLLAQPAPQLGAMQQQLVATRWLCLGWGSFGLVLAGGAWRVLARCWLLVFGCWLSWLLVVVARGKPARKGEREGRGERGEGGLRRGKGAAGYSAGYGLWVMGGIRHTSCM
jgi:hypothetical protein